MNDQVRGLATRHAALRALFAGASGLAVLAGAAPALAQSAGGTAVEEVVITGSRIRHSDLTSAAPIAVVAAEAIQQQGATNVAQVLNRMPEFGSQSAQEQGFGSSPGLSSVELRNLGPVRTLVLVNGQRMTPSGGQVVDFNAIPAALIERVDVLKDGASPIYGSDAVGGVVNVILRRKFDGVIVTGQAGVSSRGDRETYEASAILGNVTDRSNFLLGLGYSRQGVVKSIDRDFAHLSLAEGGQTIRATPTVGRFQVRSGPNAGYYIGTSSGGYQKVASTSDPAANLNVGDLIYIVDPQKRLNVTAAGEYEIAPQVRLYAEGMFANSQPSHQAALFPIGDAYVTDKWPTGLIVPARLPDGSANPLNPYGQDLGLRVAPGQLGQRLFRNTYNTFQTRFGARGALGDYNWSVGYTYGESDHRQAEDNSINFTHAAQMLGMIPCTAQEVAQGCVLTNFAGNRLTPAQIRYVTYTAVSTDRYTQDFWHATVDGPLLTLPAGELKFAAGVESRRESFRSEPDALKVTGDYYGGTSYPTKGDYRVHEGYVEMDAPIFRDAPFARKLNLDAAVRVSSYSLDKVGEAVTWKAGAVWSPVQDLTFRGHYGTGIRAPTVLELFDGGSTRVLGYVDPCDLSKGIAGAAAIANCQTVLTGLGVNPTTFRQQLAGMTTTTIGNRDLDAEKSKNLTLGVIVQPRWTPRLSLTLDYYDIEVTGAIASTSSFAQVLINQCYASPNLSSESCALFTPRQATSGGAFGTMAAKNINLGFIKTHGWDIGLNYAVAAESLRLPADGEFSFEGRASYQPSFKVQQPTGTVTEFAGVWRTATDSSAYPEWRASAMLTYRADNWSVGWLTRFIEGTVRQGGNPAQFGVALPDVYYHDVTADYQWKDVKVGVGVRNLFDKQPPYALGDLYTNTVTNVYDFIGRYTYLRVSTQF